MERSRKSFMLSQRSHRERVGQLNNERKWACWFTTNQETKTWPGDSEKGSTHFNRFTFTAHHRMCCLSCQVFYPTPIRFARQGPGHCSCSLDLGHNRSRRSSTLRIQRLRSNIHKFTWLFDAGKRTARFVVITFHVTQPQCRIPWTASCGAF